MTRTTSSTVRVGRAASPAQLDFDERPFIVIWEMTQACDLVCVHCRACAQPRRSALELSTSEAERLIDQIAAMQVPVFVLTGGDPLKRPDVYHLVEYATRQGVRTSLTPSATPLLTQEAIQQLHACGLARLAVSLDGSTAEIHDAFRGVRGSYERTLQAIEWARAGGLPVQINTTITRRNLGNFEEMVRLLERLEIVLWSVFFLVPTGRGQTSDLISAEEFEEVFAKLYEVARRAPFDIKTTEAQHYRRYVAQRRAAERRAASATADSATRSPIQFPSPAVSAAMALDGSPAASWAGGAASGGGAAARNPGLPDGIGRAPRGLNDAKGFVFVSHAGEVFPSGFLPTPAGNIRRQPLAEIYRHSPLFVALRDSSNLQGKCGVCEFREICGGSRARAFALTGDPFAEEPCCVYQPGTVAVAG
ncbi:MAG TPA: radical SAM protein [Terriglobia bacterium]|nr:radical SAM protein [Terriglobia bacterium]